jgi:hypothetical protein
MGNIRRTTPSPHLKKRPVFENSMIDLITTWNALCQTARLKLTNAGFFSSAGSADTLKN